MKKEIIRNSPVPYYLAGLCWLVYSLLLPFYRLTDILVAAVLSAAAFFVGKKVFAPRRELVEVEEVFAPSGSRLADDMVAQGQILLKDIRFINDKIGDPALSAQITDLEDVCRQIFKEVARRPQKAPLIRRSLEYYLPVTLKLLKSYYSMEEQQTQGKMVQTTMQKIAGVMETVLKAFRNQLDGLYQDEALDISTDITVLQGMLAQEGLLPDEMKTTQ
jgi:hypothetical protein